MPNVKSAAKRLKTNEKRWKRNKFRKAVLKTTLKKLKELIEHKKVEEAREFLKQAISVIDKTCKVGVIHKNRSAKLKSKLMKKVAELGKN